MSFGSWGRIVMGSGNTRNFRLIFTIKEKCLYISRLFFIVILHYYGYLAKCFVILDLYIENCNILKKIYEKHCLIPPNKIRERFAIWILSRRSPPGRRAAGFCACLLNRCLIKITFLSATISFLMNCFYGNLFFVLKKL